MLAPLQWSSRALGTPHSCSAFRALPLLWVPVLGVVVVPVRCPRRGLRFRQTSGLAFPVYVWLTIGGLATLGAGLVTGGISMWLGWLTVAVAVLCTAAYVSFKDIPPFVFYILFVVIGVVLL